ncbi:hypothetical protein TNCT_390361 [Trichonephila clavata]|uniref:Uncharacterized protein n=1 Tax=Trichonephila clavata TaxID=2740835 RepID=A0A8X6KX05_TRICU|nr:hypothetical protein TNCT_390361 [Trichonephila clavata]
MELEAIRVFAKMETNIGKIVLPPTEKNGLTQEAANFSWADRVENSTPSLDPGSLCLDRGQIPSISSAREQQTDSTKMILKKLQQACSVSIRLFIIKTKNTFSAI